MFCHLEDKARRTCSWKSGWILVSSGNNEVEVANYEIITKWIPQQRHTLLPCDKNIMNIFRAMWYYVQFQDNGNREDHWQYYCGLNLFGNQIANGDAEWWFLIKLGDPLSPQDKCQCFNLCFVHFWNCTSRILSKMFWFSFCILSSSQYSEFLSISFVNSNFLVLHRPRAEMSCTPLCLL